MKTNRRSRTSLTFRTYGTWYHGDERGSVDRSEHNLYRAPRIPHNPNLVETEKKNQLHPTFIMNSDQRKAVYAAIREVCIYRAYSLFALNVRSNHAHGVVSALVRPEKIIEAFKSYATRRLKKEGLISADIKVWSRHGSTRYLWKESSVAAAIDYVLYCQDEEIPEFF
jgi:REP element-mobilizing transposase RayT